MKRLVLNMKKNNNILPLFFREVGKYFWNDKMVGRETLVSSIGISWDINPLYPSPCGKYYVSMSPWCVYLHKADNHQDPVYTIQVEIQGEPWIKSICFSPDGKNIAYIDTEKIAIHDLQTGVLLQTLAPIWNKEQEFAYSPDGRYIATPVEIWDLQTGKAQSLEIRSPYYGWSIQYSQNGLFFVVKHQLYDIELYDIKNQIWIRPQYSHSAGYDKPVFSPCGQFIAGTGDTRTKIKIWDVNTLKPTVFCETTRPCDFIAYSPCGQFIALGLRNGTIEIRKVRTGKCIRSWPAHGNQGTPELDSLTWSRDGRFIQSYGRNKTYKKWRV